jgi:hypothetical protein
MVKSLALLEQHVFQAVVCIECRAECVSITLHGTRYTQQSETHVATTLQNF